MIRQATPEDLRAYALLQAELNTPDPPPDAARFAAELAPDILVWDEGGAVRGAILAQVLHGPGYIRLLAVDPAWRRKGVGRALMLAGAERLRQRGCRIWELSVRRDNEAAMALYESLGMTTVFSGAALWMEWADIHRVPSVQASVATVEPAEDADLEAALGLVPGELDLCRRSAGRQLWKATGPGGEKAVACFDPGFPGCNPFRTQVPALAGSLLEVLRPKARPGDAGLHLAIADDPELEQVLRDAGGRVWLETYRMRGNIPEAALALGS